MEMANLLPDPTRSNPLYVILDWVGLGPAPTPASVARVGLFKTSHRYTAATTNFNTNHNPGPEPTAHTRYLRLMGYVAVSVECPYRASVDPACS